MANNNTLHPMLAHEERIQELGLMVFDSVHGLPLYHEPYTAPYLTITLNMQGWLRADYDLRPVTFKEHEVAIVHPNHTLCAHETSEDYHAILLVLSRKFTEEMRRLTPSVFLGFQNYILRPSYRLNDAQYDNVLRMMKLLQSISLSNSPSRQLMLKGLLHILATMLQDYRRENGGTDVPLTTRQELFARFHQAIVEHYQESREVRFYADLFCLTPKHFASVIKQVTGINASDWISSYVMVQAKTLLLSSHQLTVQQVANRLGFTDQASFSRYFKTNEGISPSEFRERPR